MCQIVYGSVPGASAERGCGCAAGAGQEIAAPLEEMPHCCRQTDDPVCIPLYGASRDEIVAVCMVCGKKRAVDTRVKLQGRVVL